jgi:hypothetical protein
LQLHNALDNALGFAVRKLLLFIAALYVGNSSSAAEPCTKASSQWAHVHEEHVSLATTPEEKSAQILDLTLGDSVCVLETRRVGATEWVYVLTQYKRSRIGQIRGWTSPEFITYKNRLKHHVGLARQQVSVEIGDYFATYHVAEDGSFKVYQSVSEHKCKKGEAPNEYGACEDFEWVQGNFYGNGILAIAVSKKYGALDVFKLLSGGKLCAWQHGEPPPNCR